MQVTGLEEGQWYSYRVKALNRLGASKPSKPTDEIQAVDTQGIYFCCCLFICLFVLSARPLTLLLLELVNIVNNLFPIQRLQKFSLT